MEYSDEEHERAVAIKTVLRRLMVTGPNHTHAFHDCDIKQAKKLLKPVYKPLVSSEVLRMRWPTMKPQAAREIAAVHLEAYADKEAKLHGSDSPAAQRARERAKSERAYKDVRVKPQKPKVFTTPSMSINDTIIGIWAPSEQVVTGCSDCPAMQRTGEKRRCKLGAITVPDIWVRGTGIKSPPPGDCPLRDGDITLKLDIGSSDHDHDHDRPPYPPRPNPFPNTRNG